MKKITVIVKRNMFPDEESYQAFINFEDDQFWYYNQTQNIFSKGNVVRARDWHNRGDEYLAASEIRDIIKTGKPDEYDIFFEPHPLWGINGGDEIEMDQEMEC